MAKKKSTTTSKKKQQQQQAEEKPTRVTSLEEMKQDAAPIVAIPGWTPGSTINVRLRRITLLSLIQNGKLPNELLGTAHKMIVKSKGGQTFNPLTDGDMEELKEFVSLLHCIAKAALVEPTYDEIVEEVGPLVDRQLAAIFNWANERLESLEPFRNRSGSGKADSVNGEDVGSKTK